MASAPSVAVPSVPSDASSPPAPGSESASTSSHIGVSHTQPVLSGLSEQQQANVMIDLESEGQHEIDETAAPSTNLVSHRLSAWSYVFLLSLVLVEIVIATNIRYAAFAITFPLTFLPSLLLIYWWWINRSMTRLDTVVTSFAIGFWPATLIVTTMQIFFLFVAANTVYRFSIHLGLIVTAYFVLATPEEMAKYMFSRSKLAQNAASVGTKANLIYSTSAALGYATASTFVYSVYIVAATIEWNESSFHFGYALLFFSFFMCFFAFLPVHVLTAYLIGLKVHMRTLVPEANVRLRDIIGVPILARGTLLTLLVYNIVLLVQLRINGAILLVLDVLFSLILVLIPLAIYIRKVEKQMPLGYIRRVGALSLMGYGVLSDGNEEEDRAMQPVSPVQRQAQSQVQGQEMRST